MNIFKVIIVLATSMIISFSAFSAENDITVVGGVEMPEVQNSTAFNHVKKKLGKWEGKLTQGLTGAVYDASYEFELTSGGNTITETVIEDGVQMLTTYSDNDGELVIKHYCVLGTEPIFKVDTLSKMLKKGGDVEVNINVVSSDKAYKIKLKDKRIIDRKTVNLIKNHGISTTIH